MRNQVIMWALFVIPWLSLFLMKREDIKRLMPVAICSALSVIIINEFGLSYGWWSFPVTSFPIERFHPDFIGLFPVMTMWIFYFTYQKFWLFLVTEIIVNLCFGYIFVCWFIASLGIVAVNNRTGFMVFILSTGLSLVLYAYQSWQEGIFIHPLRKNKGNPEHRIE